MPDAARDVVKDLELLIRSRYGLVHVRSDEEDRVVSLLRHLSDAMGLTFFTWSRSRGLGRADGHEGGIYDTAEPLGALRHITASTHPALYLLAGLTEQDMGNPTLVAHLKDAAGTLEDQDGAVVLTGHDLPLPGALEHRAAVVSLPAAGQKEYRELLVHLLRDMGRQRDVTIALSKEEVATLLKHLSGLTLLEAEKVLTKAIVEDHSLTVEDIRHVIDAKKEVVEREGLLEYYPVEESWTEVAGMTGLKAWLRKRTAVVRSPEKAAEFGLTFPRGMLLLGVPGCGKSLSAKAVASEWSLPLLKLDPSNLYNKYIGESEKNFKRAMRAAERMAPVVLWIDELEKAFAQGGSEDGGVSQRILGSFLTWMQERRGDVFVVATANDVQRLPPEFLRKGRFDEIFF
ncbi:MAG: AAA family ATPase, partial [Gemmatimonadetes bacterium]|nr:AAA family ATPase [Gemmatimonadota bacterium]